MTKDASTIKQRRRKQEIRTLYSVLYPQINRLIHSLTVQKKMHVHVQDKENRPPGSLKQTDMRYAHGLW